MRSPLDTMRISTAVSSVAHAAEQFVHLENESLKTAAEPLVARLETIQAEIEKLFQVE